MAGGVLIPYPKEAFAVSYYTDVQVLSINIAGSLPPEVIAASLQRDTWVGGLKFSLLGYYGGFGHNPPKTVPAYHESITLPLPHFNSKSVLIQTAGADPYKIPIRYLLGKDDITGKTDLTETTEPGLGVQVLPPIRVVLVGGHPGEHRHRITTSIPKGGEYNITTRYNPEYIRIWAAGLADGSLFWDITWEQTPPGDKDPQIFSVVKERAAGPVISPSFEIIQPYHVYLGLLKRDTVEKS